MRKTNKYNEKKYKFKFRTMTHEEYGTWNADFFSREERWNVNLSSIQTELIKEAAKCRRFSSDLLYIWPNVDKKLRDHDFNGDDFIFAFRPDGVDSRLDYETKTEEPEMYGQKIYFSAYLLRINRINEEDIQIQFGQLDSTAVL